MSNVTLTRKNGDTLELSLPLRGEELLNNSVGYYVAYGKASVSFDTANAELNDRLGDCIPDSMEGGLKELSLLAYILDIANDDELEEIKTKLPEQISGAEDVTQHICAPIDLHRLKHDHERTLKDEIAAQRITGGQLFEKTIESAKANSDLARFESIHEYILPDDTDKTKLCSYEFDMLPAVNFGGSEGIYIDCYLKGSFDESDRSSLHIGTIKTLSTDLDACKTMGELCGTLLYHNSQYVNANLSLFDSPESIERMLTKPLSMEQEQAQTQEMLGQQM